MNSLQLQRHGDSSVRRVDGSGDEAASNEDGIDSKSRGESGEKLFINPSFTEDISKNPGDYNRPRVKFRSASFKLRTSADAIADSIQTAKLRREEHVDKIRKLEIVQQKLSSKKLNFIPEHESVSYSEEMHDTGYDPTNEMHMILYGPSELSSSGKHNAASGDIFEKLEKMLDKKFEPLHTNMSMLEEKFLAMHIDAQSNFSSMRADFQKSDAVYVREDWSSTRNSRIKC